MFDFAVIGAGVIGGMVARELTKYTDSVCILEKGADVALGATRANSAIVHAGYDAAPGSLKALLNVRGSKMMAEVCRNLGVKSISGIELHSRKIGINLHCSSALFIPCFGRQCQFPRCMV